MDVGLGMDSRVGEKRWMGRGEGAVVVGASGLCVVYKFWEVLMIERDRRGRRWVQEMGESSGSAGSVWECVVLWEVCVLW